MTELFVKREGAQTAKVGDFFCLSAAPLDRISILKPDPPAEMVDVPATLWFSIMDWCLLKKHHNSIFLFIKNLVTSGHFKRYLVHKSEDRRYNDPFGGGTSPDHFYTFHPDTNIVVVFVDSIEALSKLSSQLSAFVNHSINYYDNNISAHIFAHTTAGDGDAQKLNTIIVAIYDFGKK